MKDKRLKHMKIFRYKNKKEVALHSIVVNKQHRG